MSHWDYFRDICKFNLIVQMFVVSLFIYARIYYYFLSDYRSNETFDRKNETKKYGYFEINT